MKYRVAHTTAYHYDAEVCGSYGQLHLQPRPAAAQRCQRTEVMIEPAPDDYRERSDFFGNRTSYFEIRAPHRSLFVSSTSWIEVEVGARQAAVDALRSSGRPWEAARAEDLEFVLDSRLVSASDALAAYGAESFRPGRPVVEAVEELTSRIYHDFAFRPGATRVTTTAEEVLANREGVCQDFAHLAIGCLRSLGLSARYVSGYLETIPPPGKARIQGADVSHAWASLGVAGHGWVDFDPTNNQLVNDRYVVTAWGRDYADVPPLMGIIFTEGTKHDLEVLVDVVRED